MLFQLGLVTIDDPGPFNADGTEEDFGAGYAVKPVVGAAPNREFVGPDDTRMVISGTLFPHFFSRHGQASGLSEVEMLRAITATGKPQCLVRGDGVNLGWWLVDRVRQRSKHLSRRGVGREIAYEIQLVQSPDAASPADILSTLTLLFA